ncbi:MAG: carbohydrate ABC transporter permease [Oscillospiraceae bacterium]|jgi:multiple sugar transport system permease protein|nr:carbohydrate ABC transporter permease [Oscillospiraceae bacterium]
MQHAIARPKRVRPGRIILYAILIMGAFVMIFPFIWMILTSFKTEAQTIMVPLVFFPPQWSWFNYTEAFRTLPFGAMYVNTLLLIFYRVLCATVFSSMAGFAFAKLKFPGKGFFFALIITQLMLPGQIFIIPQYQMVASLGQLNTLFALVFPGLVSAFGAFFLRQFYMSLPNDLMEAALLDGCNIPQTFVRILFPLTKTALFALAIFTAVFAYSDMMWPLIVNMQPNKMTLSAGINSLRGQFSTNYPIMMAGSAVAMIPMIVLYVFMQRHFIEGIALTGTKA